MSDKQNIKNIHMSNAMLLTDAVYDCIEFTDAYVYDMESAIRASGLPKTIGRKEAHLRWDRARALGKATPASGHDCFLKGISVHVDIRAGRNWWIQFMRYHFQDTVSSQSTMHNILSVMEEALPNVFSVFTAPKQIEIMSRLIFLVNLFDNDKISERERVAVQISTLMDLGYGKEQAMDYAGDKQALFTCLIHSIPQGVYLKARVTLSYLQIKNMLSQRANHPQAEWKRFAQWCRELPHLKSLLYTNPTKQSNDACPNDHKSDEMIHQVQSIFKLMNEISSILEGEKEKDHDE